MTLFLLAIAGVTLASIVASIAGGSRLARRRRLPRVAGIAIVLASLVLIAAVVAIAIAAPGRSATCNAPMRDDVAAVIAVYAIPPLAVALVLALAAVVTGGRRWRPGVLAVALCLAAAIVDLIALTQSVRFCLE